MVQLAKMQEDDETDVDTVPNIENADEKDSGDTRTHEECTEFMRAVRYGGCPGTDRV